MKEIKTFQDFLKDFDVFRYCIVKGHKNLWLIYDSCSDYPSTQKRLKVHHIADSAWVIVDKVLYYICENGFSWENRLRSAIIEAVCHK